MKNKPVVIIGASRGIGRAIAEQCAREGAKLVLGARKKESLQDTARECLIANPQAEILSVACDAGERDQVESLLAAAQEQFGPIYGLVCAAGILGSVDRLEECDLEEWEETIRINLLGPMYCAHFAIPQMKKAGGGRIVLFSGGGQGPQPRRTAYTASKGAIWRFTESLGAELREDKIFVNAIAPGAVNTHFLEAVLEAGEERVGKVAFAEALQQKKTGGVSPGLAAKLAAWLLSERSAPLSGKVLSAQWDEYETFTNLAALSDSDLYTFKRVIKGDGATRWK